MSDKAWMRTKDAILILGGAVALLGGGYQLLSKPIVMDNRVGNLESFQKKYEPIIEQNERAIAVTDDRYKTILARLDTIEGKLSKR